MSHKQVLEGFGFSLISTVKLKLSQAVVSDQIPYKTQEKVEMKPPNFEDPEDLKSSKSSQPYVIVNLESATIYCL